MFGRSEGFAPRRGGTEVEGGNPRDNPPPPAGPPSPRFAWEAEHLVFTVREPFPSKTTTANLVFGRVEPGEALNLESHMPERGVIFSDGVESDFLDFNSGVRARIELAEKRGLLVV